MRRVFTSHRRFRSETVFLNCHFLAVKNGLLDITNLILQSERCEDLVNGVNKSNGCYENMTPLALGMSVFLQGNRKAAGDWHVNLVTILTNLLDHGADPNVRTCSAPGRKPCLAIY